MAPSPLPGLRALARSVLTVVSIAQAQSSLSSSAGQDGVAASATTVTASATAYRPKFTVPADADVGQNLIPNIEDPQAVDAQTVCPGYKASGVRRDAYGFAATLSLAGHACNVYGTDIETLNLTVQYQNADRLAINISPANIDASNSSHYILPEQVIPRPVLDADADSSIRENDFQVAWSNDPSFSFTVIRRSTGDVVFSTEGSVLVYEDQFVEFVTSMPAEYNIYGLGERIHGLRLGTNFTATIYAADVGDPIDDNIYGSHPFYLDTRYFEVDSATGNLTYVSNAPDAASNASFVSYSHGVFLRNAHGQEILLRPDNVTWRTLGGSIDLFFFDGPSQPEVTKQYQHGAVGLPAMQQYFTFGYHQCRWGYANWSQFEEVVDNFIKFEIPLENIWLDIDYMLEYRDFTSDPNTFPVKEGLDVLQRLHDGGRHFIPIVDSAIYIPNPENETDAYATYTRGNESGAFLKNPDGSEYIGAVWPGYTVFPDWLIDTAVPWWSDELVRWHKEVPFDGIWIDMSEVSSFCVGSCGSGNLSLNPAHPPFSLPGEPGNVIYDYPEGFNITNATEAASASSASSSQAAATSSAASSSGTTSYLRTTPTPGVRNVNYPPYVIDNVQGDLAVHAVSPNATHFNGVEEYDVHNLFGHQILNATYQGLLDVFPGKRPFIIGRSTFAGSGKWAGHWGGDNYSKWAYMYFGIPQALSFSLFGIPMFGVDTCGFNGNSDEELCNRWMQLSAFFPFYRNHNTLSAKSQEPYVWSSVIDASKKAMAIRYALLPYLYTLFHAAHSTGATVMRALAWEFPDDPSLANVDTQFLLGPSLLVTPVLAPNASTVRGVFPGRGAEKWYDWYSQQVVDVLPGENKTLDAPLGHIPVFVRGGSILPLQEPRLTTKEARRTPWALLVALGKGSTAKGELYLDDGESLNPNETLSVAFVAERESLSASAVGLFRDGNALANVTVLGVASEPSAVRIGGVDVGKGRWAWSRTSKVLSVTRLDEVVKGGAWDVDWTLTW
ncbi:Glycoside hydrolase family 31 [Macrophomina phaseolina MS6]|uniref:alpha-glucosidase n=1 Tax=Macrophomina phaseolina (strain MS6) TaxID=1126212 RepID=K2RTX5_MACPH|nr:Glycoside hydrolase family 31 [Macrophomina phaseolina MS6]